MIRPLLFDSARLQGRTDAEKLRQDLIVKFFGELTDLDEWPDPTEILPIWDRLSPDCRRECERAAAEELLLRQVCRINTSAAWNEALANTPPFDDDQPLSLFAGMAAACALFPIDAGRVREEPAPRTNGAVGMGHVWILGHPDATQKQRFISHPRLWHGHSCELAAALALKAVASQDTDMIQKIATKWIITGQENGGAIEQIELGNKLAIAPYTSRKWIIPAANRDTLPIHFPGTAGRRLAHDLNSAWNHIAGAGILRQEDSDWPKIDAFHSFTSGAREPVLATILLSPGVPHQLWHSEIDISSKPACDIVQIMADLGVEMPEPKGINSSDMAAIESKIAPVLVPQLEQGTRILFNVTQGNRLMSFAIHSLAQQYENLLLMYRDLDAKPFEFTLIHYEGGHPVTQNIRGKDQRNDIEWSTLFFKPKPRDPESWQDLLKRIRKKNSVPASTES